MKFSFKTATKNIGTEAADLGLMIGGAVASKKFLDFANLSFFKEGAAKDPNGMMAKAIKYQGAIKLVGGLVARKYVKNKYIKSALTGVAFEGGLNLIRQFTQKQDGTNYIDQIGKNPGQMRAEMDQSSMGADPAYDYQSGVGGVGDTVDTDYEDLTN